MFVADGLADEVAHLTILVKSTDPVLRTLAQDALDKLLLKFNPAEPRLVTGEWTAGGGGSGSGGRVQQKPATSQQPGREQRRAQAARDQQANRETRQRAAESAAADRQAAASAAAAGRRADSAQLADVRAQVSAGSKTSTPKGASSAAVTQARKDLGIPSGKKLKRLSAAKQHAAAQILDATRRVVAAHAKQAKAQARVEAIRRALGAKNLRPKTRAWLDGQLAKATANLNTIAGQIRSAQSDLAAGKKAWRGR